MPVFGTDSIVLWYNNVEAAKQWWMRTFECKQAKVKPDWDYPLPSDVALELPDEDPTILLSDRAEAQEAKLAGPTDHPIIFCSKIEKAHKYLLSKGAEPGPIQETGTRFFEIRDCEGNVIEVCEQS
jgi:hypothetical protein